MGPSWPQIKGFGNYLAKSMPKTILLTNKTVTKDANRTRYMVMAVIQSNYIYIYVYMYINVFHTQKLLDCLFF